MDPSPPSSGMPSPLCSPSHSTRPLQNLALDPSSPGAGGRCSCLLEAGPHPAGLPDTGPHPALLHRGSPCICAAVTIQAPSCIPLIPSPYSHLGYGQVLPHGSLGKRVLHVWLAPTPHLGAGTGFTARRAHLGHLSPPVARTWPLELRDAPQAPPVHTCALPRLAFRHHPLLCGKPSFPLVLSIRLRAGCVPHVRPVPRQTGPEALGSGTCPGISVQGEGLSAHCL